MTVDTTLIYRRAADGATELLDRRGYHVATIHFNERVDPNWKADFLRRAAMASDLAEFAVVVGDALDVKRNRFGKLEPTATEFAKVRALFQKHGLTPTIAGHGDMAEQIRQIAATLAAKLED